MTENTVVPTVLASREIEPGRDFVATTAEGYLMISHLRPTGSLDLIIPVEAHPALGELLRRILVALDDPTPGPVDYDGNEVLVDLEVAPGVHLASAIRRGETMEESMFSILAHGANVDRSGVMVPLPHTGALIKLALTAVGKLGEAEASAATKH